MQFYTLRDILDNHSAADLKKIGQYIKLKGYYKMKKEELIAAISDHILDEKNLEESFLVASDKDIEIFEKALKEKQSVEDVVVFRYWESLLLAFISLNGEVDIPLEVKDQYLKLKNLDRYKETREKIKIIHSYILACTNLYSVIDANKLTEIINSQTSLGVDREEVIHWCITRDRCNFDFLYYYEEGYIINGAYRYQSTDDNDLKYEDMVKMQEGKPYYIPDKEELLRYADDSYIEENEAFKDLLNYMKTKLKISEAEAYNYCATIQLQIRNGSMPSEVLEDCQRNGLKFLNKKQIEDFMKYFARMYNNTRMPENNGFTPDELNQGGDSASTFDESNVIPFPEGNNGANKISRNSPCPCGSGKKYKKCCGKNL